MHARAFFCFPLLLPPCFLVLRVIWKQLVTEEYELKFRQRLALLMKTCSLAIMYLPTITRLWQTKGKQAVRVGVEGRGLRGWYGGTGAGTLQFRVTHYPPWMRDALLRQRVPPLEYKLHVLLKVQRVKGWVESLHWSPVSIDEELDVVPLYFSLP